jgi:uncharacterized protein YyaL (SSP411 family)
MANHLSDQSSPYLLQHAGNPVDWYPWGPEALEKARSEDKPIFLSIGYSACHWCHVMERESFEDESIAAFLNEHFVSIKVDREERPDLDAVYMDAVQTLTGHGGWPLSAWLTPDGAPFYGGTYFPPTPRPGLPSFLQVLGAISAAWTSRRADLDEGAVALREHLRRDADAQSAGSDATRTALSYAAILERADADLHASVDRRQGGWGGAPKFPQPMVLEYLLARLAVSPQPQLEVDIEVTLDAMAAGGMYDHLAGGFHRYSTDDHWLVPHFEKMLYDNAQLARCYVHAWQLLGKARYRAVATETLDYLLREMQHPQGGFFSAQDADTAEGEGAYFTWTIEEVRGALDPVQAAAIESTYGLTQNGNFEGRNILHLPGEFPVADGGYPDGDAVLAQARAKLLEVRQTRPRPARDEKILAAWNGLALTAFAEAAVAFGSSVYQEAAERAAEFILGQMIASAGPSMGPAGEEASARTATRGAPSATSRLSHSWKDGRVSGQAFLDDHACVAEGFLALYRCTFDELWFLAARDLVDDLAARFGRPAGGFYDTSGDHEALIARPRAAYDSPTPTGNSMAATVLLKMAAYTGEDRYRELAEDALASLAPAASPAAVMSGQWLSAALLAHEGAVELAIVGDLTGPTGEALLATVRDRFRPLVVMAARLAGVASRIPLLLEREPQPGEEAAAWVCRHSTCAAPTAETSTLKTLLGDT